MIILISVFVIFVLYLVKVFVAQEKECEQQELFDMQEVLEGFLQKKEEILQKKKVSDDKAAEVFTLYDMTKEIVKKLNEQEAFEVFRASLEEHVKVEECRLVCFDGDRRKKNLDPKEYFIFSIKSRRGELGQIGVKGLIDDEKDKFIILAQQFALALQRVRLYQEIEKSAITDSLTGVHTRRYIMERLEEEIQRAVLKKIKMSFLMIDVDRFKDFNDKHGHLAGDQILRSVSLLIQENIREIDFVGRYGGEEFCVVLPDTDADGGFFVGDRIRRAIEEAEIIAYDAKVKITVSIGIACLPEDAGNALEVIDKADWALYRSKKRGRNCTTAFGMYNKNK